MSEGKPDPRDAAVRRVFDDLTSTIRSLTSNIKELKEEISDLRQVTEFNAAFYARVSSILDKFSDIALDRTPKWSDLPSVVEEVNAESEEEEEEEDDDKPFLRNT